uniref:Uncharacterized protein n=1 Tax=Rhizophora mucronata TaxID=61149 RepID=A0A2P2Q5G5_RHIMU
MLHNKEEQHIHTEQFSQQSAPKELLSAQNDSSPLFSSR